MSKINHSSYIRFLNTVNAMDATRAGKKLDAIEEQLLDKIMLSFSQDTEVLVGDLLILSQIGSQATLHGRVKNLATKGYIKLAVDSVDNRKKKVIPTKLTLKHYEKLSKLLERAALVV